MEHSCVWFSICDLAGEFLGFGSCENRGKDTRRPCCVIVTKVIVTNPKMLLILQILPMFVLRCSFLALCASGYMLAAHV